MAAKDVKFGGDARQLMSTLPVRTAVTLTDPDSGELVFDVLIAGPDDGPAVILLHGWALADHTYRDVISSIASHAAWETARLIAFLASGRFIVTTSV